MKIECFHKWKWFRDGDGNLWFSCMNNCGATINVTEIKEAFMSERYLFGVKLEDEKNKIDTPQYGNWKARQRALFWLIYLLIFFGIAWGLMILIK